MSALVSPDPSYYTFEQRSLRNSEVYDTVDEITDNRSLLKWTKVLFWLEADKTDEYVLRALKLNGMNEATMKLKKNYKYYKYFARKSVEYRINKWVRRRMTTWDVWKELGLHKKVVYRSQLDSIKRTPEYNIYVRYVNAFDSNVKESRKAGQSIHFTMVSRGASDAEMYARIRIMAYNLTDDKNAKILLGLTDRSKGYTVVLKGIALTEHEEYHWFKLFMELRQQMKSRVNL
ncbi:RxLR effector protein [Phytophthora megakarya]|uniref:RxLR effector protein n=1 Tax=Phytophthora megakarya TaxID=4795 RepID=A0A225WB92_9STRA|nr:RxLR effector protein [Phytophthora megakarya]